ncbi:unnamed protein product, partial [Ilex paraguariensis]
YVVVLDDIWNIQAWDAIKYALPDGNCGSRVLLTTRVVDVASDSCFEFRGYKYEMNALSDDESWTLFCNKTFEDKRCPQHLERPSRNILRKCEGLPLAIVAIGGILALKDKSRINEWEMVQRDLSIELEGAGKYERVKKILSLSYYDLSYHLKICFIYLSIFPEDYEIEKKQVIRLWTALQFVQETERKTSEEVATGYFNELLNRSLIQVARRSLEGRPITCRIHDLLREITLPKSKEHNIVTISSGQDVMWLDKVRHLAVHYVKDVQQQSKHLCPLRSLIIFPGSHQECRLRVLSLLVGRCKLLKVIDIRHTEFNTLPDDVSKLRHLRSLTMIHCNLETIPKSVGMLRNLETLILSMNNLSYLPDAIGNLEKLRILDLTHNNLVEFPAQIEKLQKLRRLYVGQKQGPSNCTIPAEIGNLSSLEKLYTIKAYKRNGNIVTEEIEKLTHLKTLTIADLKREDGVALCLSLQKLSNLCSLAIQSTDIIDLQSFPSGPPFLQKLCLHGPLERVPHWISCLYSLVRVSFVQSCLRDDPMQCLQDLPNLLSLEFLKAYEGEELCFKAGGFPRLKMLYLQKLKELRWLRVEQGALPHLVDLSIILCHNLEELPLGIEHLHNLGKFRLIGMSDSLIETLWNEYVELGRYSKIAHIPHVEIPDRRYSRIGGHGIALDAALRFIDD